MHHVLSSLWKFRPFKTNCSLSVVQTLRFSPSGQTDFQLLVSPTKLCFIPPAFPMHQISSSLQKFKKFFQKALALYRPRASAPGAKLTFNCLSLPRDPLTASAARPTANFQTPHKLNFRTVRLTFNFAHLIRSYHYSLKLHLLCKKESGHFFTGLLLRQGYV